MFMKKILSLIVIVLIVSCTKKSSDPVQQDPGMLEGYLKENPGITVQKTTSSLISYRNGYATSRGYHFKPLKDIKITDIGGKIAEKGTFKIKISNIDTGWSKDNGWTDILTDSITITDISSFQYKTVSKEIILNADKNYVISYFNLSHNSVYDAGSGLQNEYIGMPLKINDIEIERIYWTYDMILDGVYQSMEQGFTNGLGLFRGLVDFKYELVQ